VAMLDDGVENHQARLVQMGAAWRGHRAIPGLLSFTWATLTLWPARKVPAAQLMASHSRRGEQAIWFSHQEPQLLRLAVDRVSRGQCRWAVWHCRCAKPGRPHPHYPLRLSCARPLPSRPPRGSWGGFVPLRIEGLKVFSGLLPPRLGKGLPLQQGNPVAGSSISDMLNRPIRFGIISFLFFFWDSVAM
jgi:hypothetical protein